MKEDPLRTKDTDLSAFYQLRELVRKNKLQIIHIISVPRSSSTALERAIFQSSSISLQINDPWANFDTEKREQETYKQILEEVLPYIKEGQTTRVLIKNIADYIPPGETFDRMNSLTSYTIFLIRSPLLQLESMMRIMAKSITSNDKIFKKKTMDEYACEKRYTSWQQMQEKVSLSRDYRLYDQLYQALFPVEQTIHTSVVMQLPILENLTDMFISTLGYKDLNQYARKHKYSSWSNLLNQTRKNPILVKQFADIFQKEFLTRILGWRALDGHFQQLQKLHTKTIVIDSSLYRAMPNKYLKDLAKELHLEYSHAMVDWSKKNKLFHLGDDEGVPYYQKVVESTTIQAPVENSIAPQMLPVFIQKFLLENGGILDIYVKFLINAVTQHGYDNISSFLRMRLSKALTIEDLDPLLTYILKKIAKDNSLRMYRKKHKAFSTIFDRIDKIELEKN